MSVSTKIKARIKAAGKTYNANDSIAEFIKDAEHKQLQTEIEGKVQSLLESLIIDTKNDPNSQDTAKRVAKMYCTEVMHGRYQSAPKLKTFPNTNKLDEIVHTGPITVRSMCSHHLVPVLGIAHIGVVPGKHLFGLSKFNRACDWILGRPQSQEEAIVQLADFIEENLEPLGIIIVLKADHQCVQWRGVKDQSKMTTSHVRGIFAKNPYAKQEFFDLIKIGT